MHMDMHMRGEKDLHLNLGLGVQDDLARPQQHDDVDPPNPLHSSSMPLRLPACSRAGKFAFQLAPPGISQKALFVAQVLLFVVVVVQFVIMYRSYVLAAAAALVGAEPIVHRQYGESSKTSCSWCCSTSDLPDYLVTKPELLPGS